MGEKMTVDLADLALPQSIGTEDLPVDAVTKDVAVGIWVTGFPPPDNRGALQWMSLRLGTRDNPPAGEISAGEAEYVARVIEAAAASFRQRYLPG